ncbi:MAG: PD-(D/E)XK nuclease family transposase [Faecalibacillus sp.]|uniref:PD-(D/E)XK nuclease family transposase n=1 Tax=Faecalibacillus sp. TaxID=2678891 RepID=UPI00399A8C82
METKIKPRNRITDFKNDLVFKFMLSDLNDSRCYYLLKLIIEGITGIQCQELFVLNSEVNPEHLSDKDMVLDVRVKTDEEKLIDIEMQNSSLTKEVHYRFQIYGARMMDHQVNRGDILYSENVHEVYTILFVNDIDRDNLLLIDTYMPRNQLNHVRKYNLLTHHNVYLPFIDAVVREKGLKNLNALELAIYTLYHGITDDIISLNSEVVIMMKEKMDQFNEDEELVLAASKRQLVKIQHHQEKVRIRQEGKEEGLKEGELLKAKEKTLKLFNKLFPDENNELLENLTLLQYDQTFDALLENEDLKTIKKIIGK